MADTFDRLCGVLAVVESYYAANRLDLPARRYVTAGVPVWDCEQVTVRAVRRFPHEGDVLIEQPSGEWALVQEGIAVEVEIVRGAPVQSETAEPPTVPELNTAGRVMYDDGDHVLAAIRGAIGTAALPGCAAMVWVAWRNDGEAGTLMAGVSEFVLSLSS